jgi:hypothetical protein
MFSPVIVGQIDPVGLSEGRKLFLAMLGHAAAVVVMTSMVVTLRTAR